MANINAGIVNNYTIKPRNLTQYANLRGVVDFTQVGQFDQFETGYSFLSVLKMPKYMELLAEQDTGVANLVSSFRTMLQYQFRGLSGIPDVTSDTLTITDGANELHMINNVSRDTSVTISMPYFETRGSLITKFSNYYLTGIKDPMSKAKTYHGLIKNGLLEPSYENEVFTFMYYVTDNTMLRLEKAYLLANVQLVKAEESMYDSTKGDINNKELSIDFTAFPITGYEVDKAAKVLLQDINGVSVSQDSAGNVTYNVQKETGVAALDSTDYTYGIMNSDSPSAIASLTDAIKNA